MQTNKDIKFLDKNTSQATAASRPARCLKFDFRPIICTFEVKFYNKLLQTRHANC